MEAPPRPQQDSERRQATVLFADISGFTSMSEKLDPEEVTDIISGCLSTLAEAVSRYGGHVDKYIGDCVMALFGVPTALEDAPQQAINAAIDMRKRLNALRAERRLSVPIDIHIGINTGLVIAGNVGGEVKQEFTVVGDAVNLASRLKDKAPNGSIWVGPATYRYARDDFEWKKLAPLTLKGKEQPVDAYELLSGHERAHRSRPTGAADRHIASALVGRENELLLVRACFGAVARGEGGIVHLMGEAGLGKSRLLAEACASADASAVTILEGRSLSLGHGLSFHPFIDLLRHWAGIDEDEPDPDAQAKLAAAVGGRFGDRADDILPFVATMMGIRLTGAPAARLEGIAGDALEKLVFKSMRELLEALAAARPLVLIFEDLHWADQSSIQLLDSLLRLVVDCRVLFVLAYRPDHADTSGRILEAARARLATQQTEITLEPLRQQHVRALVENLLKTPDLPPATVALISRTAEGNPFFIEEVVRSLIDDGVVEQVKGRLTVTAKIDAVVIPDTIQGVIMARLDRLPRATRNLLQTASVLGRSFYHRLLAALIDADVDLDAALTYLKERQLLVERRTRRTSTVARRMLAEELEYVFKHALTQEMIYESILQRTRKELHQKVAEAIETVFAARLADFYGMLAYHYSRAQMTEKAEEYLFRAGDEAARSAASSEALHFFREASRLYMMMHGEGGDPAKKALLERNIGLALLNKGSLLESIDHFDRALTLLDEPVARTTWAIGRRLAVDLTAVLWRAYVRRGRYGTARNLEHERIVLGLFYDRGRAEVTSDPVRIFCELFTGLRRLNRVDPRQIEQACAMYLSCAGIIAYSGLSFAVSRRMLAIAQSLLDETKVQELFVYREARFVYHYLLGDDWSDAQAIDPALVDQDLRLGQVWDVGNYLGLDCDRRLRRGDFAGARAILTQLADISDQYGFAFARTNHDGMLAVLLLEQRHLGKALATAEAYYGVRHEEALRVFALGLIAKANLLLGRTAAAATALTTADALGSRSRQTAPWHLSGYLLARLLFDVTALEAATAKGDASARLRRAAQRSARRAIRVSAVVAKERTETYRLVGSLWWLLGRQNRAAAWWKRSLAAGEQLGARPELARTHVEIAQRLKAAGHDRIGDLDAREHQQRAHEILSELSLTWDLAQIDAPTSPALVSSQA